MLYQKRCQNCGQEADLRFSKFCPNCGQKFSGRDWFLLKQEIKEHLNRKNFLFLAFFVLIFFLIFGGLFVKYKVELFLDYKRAQELAEQKKEVEIGWSLPEEVFSLVYAQGKEPLIEIEVESPDFAQLRVESEIENLSDKETKTFDLKPGNQRIELTPKITREGFEKLKDPMETDVRLTASLITDDFEKKLLDSEGKVLFHPRNELVWVEEDGTKNTKYVLGLADKDRDEIKKLVRKASENVKANGGDFEIMQGPMGDEKDQKAQLKAIFQSLSQDYDINYILSPFSYSGSEVQQIRTPSEVLEEQSGLCIELSLVMVAAMENVGLNPVLVVTRDHAWAGLELGYKSNEFVFIETTALEETPQKAVEIGEQNWEKIQGDVGGYELIRVREQRAEGFLPIGS